MTETVNPFAQRINRADEADKYEAPPDDENVLAPNFELYQELSNATDRALADDFFKRYRHLFCNGDGNLYVYRKERCAWSRDNVDKQIYAFCIHLSDHHYEVLAGVNAELAAARINGGDVEVILRRQQGIHKMILHCEKGNTISTVARLLMAKLATVMADKPVKMNPNGAILAGLNGVIDLRTGQVRRARMSDYITRNTGTIYKYDADTEWWEAAVLAMCGGNQPLAEFLQVWCGYSLTGYTNEHCMAILWGMGRNGKNLLMDSLAAAMGGYASSLPPSFLESMGSSAALDNNMLYAMAQLDGIRMAYVSETGEKGKLKESWVKGQTGDRTVRARLAYKDYYEFQLTHKLLVGTNHKPEITGTDDGVWERIRMVPMRVRFGTQEEMDAGIAQAIADRGLLERTTSTEGKEAVLRWAVAGAGKFLSLGLRKYTPTAITSETLGYRREQDVLGQFLQETTDWVNPIEVKRVKSIEAGDAKIWREMSLDDRLRVERQEFWRIYCVWCEEHGHHQMSATMFTRRVTTSQRFWQEDDGSEKLMLSLDSIKSNNVYFYRYLRLSENGYRMRTASNSRVESRERKNKEENDI